MPLCNCAKFIIRYQLIDSEGNVANSYTYDAWGNPTWKQETVSNPIRYRGYVYDDETGLYYLKARYYDPAYGRFLTEDTFEGEVKNLQSLNLYVYAENNPLVYVDSSGHFAIIPLLMKAGANGAADLMLQAAMNYFFNSETQGDISASFGAVNWWQVGRSAVEGLIPWKTPGGRLGRAAATAVGDVLTNALNQGSNYTAQRALQDFGIGFIGDLAGGGLGELVTKYGIKSVSSGLKKMGFDSLAVYNLTGTAKGLIGSDFEEFLTQKLRVTGSFKVGGREFDGSFGNIWWEAKSGSYWDMLLSDSKALNKFKSDMGDRLNIAKQNGAIYVLNSNSPIPQNIRDWLKNKGIGFTEWR